MEQYLIWKILGIEETKEETLIKQAYRSKLSDVNPEEDQEGFMKLREAYEQALDFAAKKEEAAGEDWEALLDGSEVDQWIYDIHLIYEDLDSRCNPEKWKEAFEAEVCSALDTEAEAAERLLVFIMNHYYMPTSIWRLIDSRFHYQENLEQLKEKFPENFLNYVKHHISYEDFIDYRLFQGNTTEHVDDYLYRYFEIKGLCDRYDGSKLEEIEGALQSLEEFDLYHPYGEAEALRYYLLTGREEDLQEALALAEELYHNYPDNAYIIYYCAEVMKKTEQTETAEAIWRKLLQEEPNHYGAKYNLARWMESKGELAEAKEYCLDLMDQNQTPELRDFLAELNEKLVAVYKEQLKQQPGDFEIVNKLAWCYFQMQKYSEVERLFLQVEEKNRQEYDYVNLMGRNYFAMNEYEKAMDYLPLWRDFIEQTVDDGSEEAANRFRRKAFSYFAIGYCQWKLHRIPEATESLYRSFELEENLLHRLSYMDQLADFYLEAGSTEQAIQICNQILEQEANYYPAYLKRQEAYYKDRNGQGVVDDFYQCIRIYAGYVKPYVLAYKTFYAYRQYEEAEGIWKRAEEAGLTSDEMQIYRFKVQRITKTGRESWGEILQQVWKFKKQYFDSLGKKAEGEESDLEDPAEIYLELGLLYWNLDEIPRALEQVEEGLRKYENHHRLLWLKGDLYMDQGDYQKALPCYQTIAAEDKKNADIHVNVGKCLDKIGNNGLGAKSEMALKEYEKAYKLNPTHSEVNFQLMRIYKRKYVNSRVCKEFFEKALFHANAQLELHEDAYYYIERGLLYEEAHRLEEALADHLQAAKLEPENIYAHNNAGNVCRKLRRFSQALQEYETALSLPMEGCNAWVYSNMADLQETMGDYEKALEYTQKQLVKNPNHRILLEDMARQYEKLGKYNDAIATYEKMKNLGQLEGYEMEGKIARCHYLAGAFSIAKSHHRKAIQLAQKNSEALEECYNKYAEFCRDTAQFAEASDAYDKCLDLHKGIDQKKTADRIREQAAMYYEMGAKEKAAKLAKRYLEIMRELYGDYDQYIEMNPLYGPARAFSIAMALLYGGDVEQAEHYQTQVRERYACYQCYYGKCFEACYGEGMLREAQGDLEKARELFEEALEIKPDYPECRRALKRVSNVIFKGTGKGRLVDLLGKKWLKEKKDKK